MPDLQSELSKIAHAWDSHEQSIRQPQPKQTEEKAMTFQTTGNATRDTFNFIRQNPYAYTHNSACKELTKSGYKQGTVHSLITQMKRNGMFNTDTDGSLYAAIDEYKPFTNPYKLKPANRLKPRAKPTKAEGIAALKHPDTANQTVAHVVTPTTHLMTAQAVLRQLSVSEAFNLYTELHKMFGGAK